jgi:aryl-alcohol dehydrogenase-like predicted oxidoreductase
MEYTTLGETGLEVSKLCFGCAGLGETSGGWTLDSRVRSIDLIERALDAGVTFFDTANVYGDGESESILGEALDGRRDDVVLASKVGSPVGDGPNQRGLSRKHIIDQVERSLDRLGTDYLDIYYAHRWDHRTPLEETLAAFQYLIETGLVRYVGASNCTSWQLQRALDRGNVDDCAQYAVVQPEYNLVQRHEEENLLPVARAESLGVVSYSPLAAGYLARESTGSTDPGEETWRDHDAVDTERARAVLAAVDDIADREGATPAEVSLAWVYRQDVVDAPIVGPRSVEEFESCLRALTVTVTAEDLDRLRRPIDPVWNRSKVLE